MKLLLIILLCVIYTNTLQQQQNNSEQATLNIQLNPPEENAKDTIGTSYLIIARCVKGFRKIRR
jgi:hypothetical protein